MRKRALPAALAAVLLLLIVLYYRDALAGFVTPQPGFEIITSPETVTLSSLEGSTNSTTITLKSINGFSGDTTLRVTHSPLIGHLRITLDPTDPYLPANQDTKSVLTLHVSSFIAPGDYRVEVTAVAGNLEHSVLVTVAVS